MFFQLAIIRNVPKTEDSIMIYTIYLNPTIDKTIYLDGFNVGGTNRVKRSMSQAGGKALNVATVLKNLKVPVKIYGFACETENDVIYEALSNIPHEFAILDGFPRTNIKIVDTIRQVTTEINDRGPAVTENDLFAFETLLNDLNEDDFVVLTGSLPVGCPSDYYKKLTEKLYSKVIIDASGDALKEAVKAKPFMLKPNLDELSHLTGKTYDPYEILNIVEDCKQLIAEGISLIVVSMGSRGAILVSENEAYYSKALITNPDSTVGAGDSMLAGVLSVLHNGGSLKDALLMGTAAAAATITLPGTTLASSKEIKDMLPSSTVETING